LPVKHGMHNEAMVEGRAAEISDRMDAELEQVPYLITQDGSLVRTYKKVTSQVELGWEYFERNGGIWTSRGTLKRGAIQLDRLMARQESLAKVLGLGAVPRSQVALAMANTRTADAEVRAAQERLRQRHLKVINGTSTPVE
jgi:hypothetical protein